MDDRTVAGLVAAGAAAAGALAAGAAVEHSARRRRRLEGLDPRSDYDEAPDEVRTVVAADGVTLHVEIDHPAGRSATRRKAPVTVVMAHGFTLNLDSWVFQRRALKAAGHRVVLWDQRGHGRSGTTTADFATITQLGQDLHDIIAAVAPDGDLALVGHSMGGMTIMAFARQYPRLVTDRVIAAGLVATSPGGVGLTRLGLGPTLGQVAGRLAPAVLHRLNRHAGPLHRLRRFGRNVEDALVEKYSFDSPVSQSLVRWCADMIFATSFETMAQLLPSLDALDEEASLAHLAGVEVLVLNGEGDLLTPPDHSARIVAALPGAQHVVVQEAGHLIMLEHPDLVSEQLRMLIDRGRRARRRPAEVTRKPRVRSTVTDLSRRRRVARTLTGGPAERTARASRASGP